MGWGAGGVCVEEKKKRTGPFNLFFSCFVLSYSSRWADGLSQGRGGREEKKKKRGLEDEKGLFLIWPVMGWMGGGWTRIWDIMVSSPWVPWTAWIP